MSGAADQTEGSAEEELNSFFRSFLETFGSKNSSYNKVDVIYGVFQGVSPNASFSRLLFGSNLRSVFASLVTSLSLRLQTGLLAAEERVATNEPQFVSRGVSARSLCLKH